MAIEDAAALSLVFSKKHFRGDVKIALQIYEEVRKPRASKVQAASARARENIHERIGNAMFKHAFIRGMSADRTTFRFLG